MVSIAPCKAATSIPFRVVLVMVALMAISLKRDLFPMQNARDITSDSHRLTRL